MYSRSPRSTHDLAARVIGGPDFAVCYLVRSPKSSYGTRRVPCWCPNACMSGGMPRALEARMHGIRLTNRHAITEETNRSNNLRCAQCGERLALERSKAWPRHDRALCLDCATSDPSVSRYPDASNAGSAGVRRRLRRRGSTSDPSVSRYPDASNAGRAGVRSRCVDAARACIAIAEQAWSTESPRSSRENCRAPARPAMTSPRHVVALPITISGIAAVLQWRRTCRTRRPRGRGWWRASVSPSDRPR